MWVWLDCYEEERWWFWLWARILSVERERERRGRGLLILFLVGVFVLIFSSSLVLAVDSDYLGLANGINIIFVDSSNADCNDTLSRTQVMNGTTPCCNLDRAMDIVESGDIVYVFNGTYTGYFDFMNHVLTDKIKFTAYPNEQPILTNTFASLEEVPNSEWINMSNSTHNMWKSGKNVWTGGFITTYLNGTPFFAYESWQDFYNLSMPEGTYNNASVDEIWIRFHDLSQNPNQIPLYVSGKYNSVVLIANNQGAEIEVSNFTIQYGKKQIIISNNSNVIISNCVLISGFRGIDIREAGNSSNITIKNNEIYMIPHNDWGWTDMKTRKMETIAIYSNDAESNNKYFNNKVHGHFNGIVIYASVEGKQTNTEVYNNTIYDIYDDALEIELYCDNSSFYNNKIHDVFAGVSLAYANASKSVCYLYRNLIVSNKTIKWNDISNATSSCFKIGNAGGKVSNWNINHNTCFGESQYGIAGMVNDAQYNVTWINNIFYTNSGYVVRRSGLNTSHVTYDYNSYFRNDSSYLFKYWNNYSDATVFSTLVKALASSNAPFNWDKNSLNQNPLFTDILIYDFTLNYMSPCIDTGTNLNLLTDFLDNPIYGTPDIGAYEYQPPYNSSVDKISYSSVRVYGDGKYRRIVNSSSITGANFTINSIGSDNKSLFIDVNITTWNTSGTYYKNWTEEGNTNENVSHTVADLKPNIYFTVRVDSVVGQNVTGANCTNGLCLSDASGKITFNYTGGYSSHIFEVVDATSPTLSFSCTPTSLLLGEIITCSCSATDEIDSSPTVSYTANPSTSVTGTFTTTCTATDDAGNSASSSISYSVSHSSSGGGSPSFYRNTFVEDEKEFSEVGEITKELKVKERVRIMVDGEEHYVGIAELTNTTATVEVFSTSQKTVFNVGDEGRFEVTGDDFYDIYVRLNSIGDGKANLTIGSIWERVVVEGEDVITGEVVENVEEAAEGKSDYFWLWIVSLVVVLVIGIYVRLRRRIKGCEK